jgi:hypothetical protein
MLFISRVVAAFIVTPCRFDSLFSPGVPESLSSPLDDGVHYNPTPEPEYLKD